MQDMLNNIAEASSLSELWRIIRRFYRSRGFKAIAYFLPRRPKMAGSHEMDIYQHGFPQRIVEAYIEVGQGKFDPVPRYALEKGRPVRWSETWEHLKRDANQAQVRELLHTLGNGDGYTLPVFGPNGRDAAVAIGHPIDEKVLDEVSVEHLHLVAQAAHTRFCTLMPEWPEPSNPLSAREQEILDWVAKGKSNSVIAEILHLSTGTVDTYLRRIYEKLDVSDRTSAAVRGVGMGLIAAE